FFKAMNHFLFRRAAAVTVVSAWLGDALVKHGLCTRYDVVPNVVPGLDRPLPPAGAPGHFLMVADLVDRTKNVSGALHALAIALRTNKDLRLTIIGDGPDRKMLEDLTDELGLRKSVQFLGRVPNTVVLDRMATIFAVIINSNVETFSVVTGEALAQGKPVIATRCGGPVAFIREVNGILIEPKDDAALAMAMLQLTAHATEYEPTRIRASVSDRTTPAAVGAAFHQVYQRILPNAR
ncbi:MAG: glycosyltransferase, partial [Flavobacteriales bacterium]|nr:glycosyltransferase [Flavobacteriales bacterium]